MSLNNIELDTPSLGSTVYGRANNGISSNEYDESGGWQMMSVEKDPFSVWKTIDTEWMTNTTRHEDDPKYYIHGEILEWFVEEIREDILCEHLRANVEEVHHHNLDGPVYFIRFYRTAPTSELSTLSLKLHALDMIKYELEYKMPWKRNPTYFLRIDSEFDERKIQIMQKLEELNLCDSCITTIVQVNWLYIPKIEIYEFLDIVSEHSVHQIDVIFQEISKTRPSLYICDQFVWHRETYWNRNDVGLLDDYIEVDKVAMDMCAEEWRRCHLIDDFTVDNILHLDLANKDFRDPYYNEYLDRYLNILLEKAIPRLAPEHPRRFEVPLFQMKSYLGEYLISRFHDKITIVCHNKMDYLKIRNRYDLPIIGISEGVVNLKGNQPNPEILLKLEYHRVEYNITNSTRFTDTWFKALLHKPNERQTYNIHLDKNFNFTFDKDQQFSHQILKGRKGWETNKTIVIKLLDCTESNAEKLSSFVQYMSTMFNNIGKFNVDISIWFRNCLLVDYSFLETIGTGIDDVKFEAMSFPPGQISVISRSLAKQRRVTFSDCLEINDSTVMMLLQNIDFDCLHIEGMTECTPTLHYMLAEHIMIKEDIDTLMANRLFQNMLDDKVPYNFEIIEFFRDAEHIFARNHHTMEMIDLYYLINGIEEDDDQFNPY